MWLWEQDGSSVSHSRVDGFLVTDRSCKGSTWAESGLSVNF